MSHIACVQDPQDAASDAAKNVESGLKGAAKQVEDQVNKLTGQAEDTAGDAKKWANPLISTIFIREGIALPLLAEQPSNCLL